MSKKKFWSAPIALVVVLFTALFFGGITVNAAVYDDEGDFGVDNCLHWTLDYDGTLTISGNGSMGSFTNGDTVPWSAHISNIKNVIIGNGVTDISQYSFSSPYYRIDNVKIGTGVTSIGKYAFEDIQGLTSITIPSNVTSIGEGAFKGCINLGYIRLNANITTISDMTFSGCQGIGSITLPSTVTSIGDSAFSECEMLENINLSNVTSIGSYAFYRCMSLASVDLNESLTEIKDNAFQGCYSLSSVVFPANLASIGNYAFDSTALSSIVIPEGVTNIGNYAFSGCGNVKSLELNLNNDAEFGMKVFSYCSNLKEVKICGEITTIGESMFDSCSRLETVDLSSKVINIKAEAFTHCYALTSINLQEGMTIINKKVFNDCTNLTSIKFPTTVTEIGPYAFGTSGISTIVIPSTVTKIDEGAFAYSQLSSITLPSTVTAIPDCAFMYCSKLKSFTIPSTIKSVGRQAFSCSALETVTIPSTIEEFGIDIFAGCSKLVGVTFNNGLTAIPEGMFKNCTSLTKLSLPYTVETIGVDAYCNTGFVDIIVPKNVKTLDNGAFRGCSKLTSVEFFSGIETIKEYAFENCGALEELILPASIKTIEDNAFKNCVALSNIYCYAAPGFDWTDSAKDDFIPPSNSKTTICHVDAAYLDVFSGNYSRLNVSFKGDLKEDLSARIIGHSITLSADIGVNFYFKLPSGYTASNTTVEFTWGEGADYAHKENGTMVPVTSHGANFMATCGVAARAMGDTITMVVKSGNKELIRDEYSVLKYMNVLSVNEPDNEYIHFLLASMQFYGASAQKYFNYEGSSGYLFDYTTNGTIDLCPNIQGWVKDQIKTYPEDNFLNNTVYVDDRDMTIEKVGSDDIGISYYGASAVCTSQMKIRFYFRITDAEKAAELTASFKSQNLTFKKRTVNGENLIYIETQGLKPGDIVEPFNIKINDKEYSYDFKDYINKCYENPEFNVFFRVATYQFALSHFAKRYQDYLARGY